VDSEQWRVKTGQLKVNKFKMIAVTLLATNHCSLATTMIALGLGWRSEESMKKNRCS
jgi:hypothetical protein